MCNNNNNNNNNNYGGHNALDLISSFMHGSLNQWYRLMLLCVLVHFMCIAVLQITL